MTVFFVSVLRLRQTKRCCRFLFRRGGRNNDIGELESSRSTKLYALGITAAEVAVLRYSFFRGEAHDTEWTSKEAHLAANTTVFHYQNLPISLTLNRHGRTYGCTRSIGAMDADHRLIKLFFVEIGDTNAREGRLKGALMRK